MTEPAVAYRFVLVIDTYAFGSFSKIEGISAKYHVTPVKEGGENGYVHTLPGRVSYGNVSLSRAIDPTSSLLAAWFSEYQVLLGTGLPHRPTTASVTALNPSDEPVTVWNFASIVPVTYTGPTFDANGSALAIEKFEFAHHGFWNAEVGAQWT